MERIGLDSAAQAIGATPHSGFEMRTRRATARPGAAGHVVPAHAEITGVSTDSRTVRTGDLFVALRGERFDGHRFVADAFASGAVAAVVDRAWSDGQGTGLPAGAVTLTVEDTLVALQELARWYRSRFDIPVVGVTGSNGKTTTKEMTAAALGREFTVWKTTGNYNNHVGVPLTLFGIESIHDAAVIEMGMNHAGEIARLAELARPRVGVVTNVAPAHLESMRDLDGVAQAKAELVAALPLDGTAVLNADDPRVAAMGRGGPSAVVFYGLSEDADVAADDIDCGGLGVRFTLRRTELVDERIRVEVPAPGRHNVHNALAAIAAAVSLGVPASDAAAGLTDFRAVAMRMQIVETGMVTVINDAYNANPASMSAALETLVDVAGRRPSVAVLGDMLEVGDGSREAHREIGVRAAKLGIGRLYLYGSDVGALAEGAIEAGMPPDRVHVHDDRGTLARDLMSGLPRDAVLLVKGSRGMRMEEVVELLVSEAPVS
jgi:UDP-N-acetylmuramoyl-tripeptide--D-alanyl-D-alanine ligase